MNKRDKKKKLSTLEDTVKSLEIKKEKLDTKIDKLYDEIISLESDCDTCEYQSDKPYEVLVGTAYDESWETRHKYYCSKKKNNKDKLCSYYKTKGGINE